MIYQVASIAIDAEGRWTVTYFGDVPEQGGLELKTGQLTFISLNDALTFLNRELEKQKTLYLDLIAKKA
jgi:hypothetical protein